MAAVTRRWIDVGLDGWRIDVANMTGRYRELDLTREAAGVIRSALDDDDVLVAEHGYDYRRDLDGRGWHGAMNYAASCGRSGAGSARRAPGRARAALLGHARRHPALDGAAMVGAMRAFRAGVPWQSVLHSWPLLDSHDTARFRTVTGSRERMLVGVGLQMTSPGVPMIFAGDELGLEGQWGEDARRTMPWGAPERWDTSLLDGYRRLIALAALERARSRAVGSATHTSATTRSRTCASPRRAPALPRGARRRTSRSVVALDARALEPLLGGDALERDGRRLELPGDGPAFHVWRVNGGG